MYEKCEHKDCIRHAGYIIEETGAFVCQQHYREYIESMIDYAEYQIGER